MFMCYSCFLNLSQRIVLGGKVIALVYGLNHTCGQAIAFAVAGGGVE